MGTHKVTKRKQDAAVRLDAKTHKQLAEFAKCDGRPLRHLATIAVQQYLKRAEMGRLLTEEVA